MGHSDVADESMLIVCACSPQRMTGEVELVDVKLLAYDEADPVRFAPPPHHVLVL